MTMGALSSAPLRTPIPPAVDLSLERILRGSRLYGPLEPRLLAAVARISSRQQLDRGELLWRAGQQATHFTTIHAGLLKTIGTASDGGERLISVLGPRESLGVEAAISGSRHACTAIAATDRVEVVRVEASSLLALAAREPSVAQVLVRGLLEHSQAMRERLEVLAAGSAPQRLATLLGLLAERFGDELEDGRLTIPIVLSRAELASLVATRSETTIRMLTKWQRDGIVSTMKDGMVIHDAERLRTLALAG